MKLAKKDLCGEDKKIVPGPYRLILTDKTLSLMRPTSVAPDVVFEVSAHVRAHASRGYDRAFLPKLGCRRLQSFSD